MENSPHFLPTKKELARTIRTVYGIKVDTTKVTSRDSQLFSQLTPTRRGDSLTSVVNIAQALGKYPVDYIQGLGINRIRVADQLVRRPQEGYLAEESEVRGSMDTLSGNMYVSSRETGGFVHHEIAHQIINSINPDLYDRFITEWKLINERFGLVYVGFENAFKLPYIKPRAGFVTGYAQTDEIEDIADTLSSLFSNQPNHIWLQTIDKAINAKTELVLDLLKEETAGIIGGAEWKRVFRHNYDISLFILNELKPFKIAVGDGEFRYIWI